MSKAHHSIHPIYGNPHKSPTDGLTKLEYFAGLAMQGMISDHTVDAGPIALAAFAVTYAKALIAELEKGGGEK